MPLTDTYVEARRPKQRLAFLRHLDPEGHPVNGVRPTIVYGRRASPLDTRPARAKVPEEYSRSECSECPAVDTLSSHFSESPPPPEYTPPMPAMTRSTTLVARIQKPIWNLWRVIVLLVGIVWAILGRAYGAHQVLNALKGLKTLELCAEAAAPFDFLHVCPDPLVADFAAYETGARTVQNLTSPTFHHPSYIHHARNIMQLFRSDPADASIVIRSSPQKLVPEACWPMLGTSGYLGISLPHPVYIKNFTITHYLAESEDDNHSAPRNMLLWAIVNVGELGDIASFVLSSTRLSAGSELRDNLIARLPSGHDMLPVTRLVYDIGSTPATQHFKPTYSYLWNRIKVHALILEILDNWGNAEQTCLYNLELFGRASTSEALYM